MTLSTNHEFRALTGIRGIAAVFVTLYHFKLYQYFSGAPQTFLKHGYLSVDLFFILSGFIMAFTYAHLFKNGINDRNFILFLSRRIARIYPLYIAISFIFIAFIGLRLGNIPEGTRLEPLAVLANIFMVQSWGIARSYLAVGWSISTEWAAYLLFPFLITATLFCRKSMAIVTGCITVLLLALLAYLPQELSHIEKFKGPLDISEPTNYGPLARCILEFILGLLSYRLFISEAGKKYLYGKFSSLIFGAVMVGILCFHGLDFWAVMVMPFFILSLTNDNSYLSRIINLRPIHYLGVLSYSIYLVHFLTIVPRRRLFELLESRGVPEADLVTMAIQFTGTLVLAFITYTVIEKPGRRILRKLFEPNKRIAEEPKPDLTPP